MYGGAFLQAQYPEEAKKKKTKTKIGQLHEVEPLIEDIDIEIEDLEAIQPCNGSDKIPEIQDLYTDAVDCSVIVISGKGFCAYNINWHRPGAHFATYPHLASGSSGGTRKGVR